MFANIIAVVYMSLCGCGRVCSFVFQKKLFLQTWHCISFLWVFICVFKMLSSWKPCAHMGQLCKASTTLRVLICWLNGSCCKKLFPQTLQFGETSSMWIFIWLVSRPACEKLLPHTSQVCDVTCGGSLGTGVLALYSWTKLFPQTRQFDLESSAHRRLMCPLHLNTVQWWG